MKPCPHYFQGPKGSMVCQLLRSHGIHLMAGIGNPNNPCNECQSQWKDGTPPQADNLPLVLDRMVGKKKPVLMRQPRTPIPDWENELDLTGGYDCGCNGKAKKVANPLPQVKWAYGITTCAARLETLLPKTIVSLKDAGFDSPWLFVDGARGLPGRLSHLDGQTTFRHPTIRTFGNWWLSMVELFVRNPSADYYAIFQDDFVTYRNLRHYLEKCRKPEGDYYLNLYTFPHVYEQRPGNEIGWYKTQQNGRGAVALIFPRKSAVKLLHQQHFVERPMCVKRGWRCVDGGIVDALSPVGVFEYVHNPSLVQHTGLVSSMGNSRQLLANTFRGEGFDALELLPCTSKTA